MAPDPDERGDFLFHSLIEEVANAADTWKSAFFDFWFEDAAIKSKHLLIRIISEA